MISINNFSINSDNNKLLVDVKTDVGSTITSALLWTDITYKDYDAAIDVSTLLVGTSETEVFNIDASTLGETELNGIYFIEFTTSNTSSEEDDCDNCNNPLGVTTSLLLYKLCLVNKLLAYSVCEGDCDNNRCKIINISLYLETVYKSLEFGYYDEAIDSLNLLKKLCNISKNGCKSCGDLADPIFKSGLNYGTLNGSLILI